MTATSFSTNFEYLNRQWESMKAVYLEAKKDVVGNEVLEKIKKNCTLKLIDREQYQSLNDPKVCDMDVIIDIVGGINNFIKNMEVIKVDGRYVSVANEDIPYNLHIHKPLAHVAHYIFYNNPDHQSKLADLVTCGKLICPQIRAFDFDLKGTVSMLTDLESGNCFGKNILRVSRYATFIEVSLKVPSDSIKKVKRMVDEYLSKTRRDEACVHCFSMHCDNSTEDVEDRIIVELWRNETSMKIHKESDNFLFLTSRLNTLGCLNYVLSTRDYGDVLVSYPKLPSQALIDSEINLFHVVVEFRINGGQKDKFIKLLDEYANRCRTIVDCYQTALTQVTAGAPTDKRYFVVFHCFANAQAWTTLSNTDYFRKWMKQLYTVCDIFPRRGCASINLVDSPTPLESTNTSAAINQLFKCYNREHAEAYIYISYKEHRGDATCLQTNRIDYPKVIKSNCALIKIIAAAANFIDVQVYCF